ncbi:hypothetical protein [Abyssogena phaseoliformis symbiont]|uniref:hypothetical protein n=1 Tax=Abyssogena phaseoliformis symbiont TaxID=596095 RepID=UPI00191622B4|nr:hypothetical protein [Abyssogena phaseoliformis symbiont]
MQTILKGDRVYIAEGIFDAIALIAVLKVKAINAMSTGNFSAKFIDQYQNKDIIWHLIMVV